MTDATNNSDLIVCVGCQVIANAEISYYTNLRGRNVAFHERSAW